MRSLGVLLSIAGLVGLLGLATNWPIPLSNFVTQYGSWLIWLCWIFVLGFLGGGLVILAPKLRSWFKAVWAEFYDLIRLSFDKNTGLPPITFRKVLGLAFVWFFGPASILYLIIKYCISYSFCDYCYYDDYVASVIFVLSICLFFYLLHNRRVHVSRLVDPSEVHAILDDANSIVARGIERASMADVIQATREELIRIGRLSWTEYRILTLDQLRLDPMSAQSLVARARNTLEELREYADDEEHPYPKEKFSRTEDRFRNLIYDAERSIDGSPDHENAIAKLRDELKELLEQIAALDRDWAVGKVVLNSLVACAFIAMLTFFSMGLLPVFAAKTDALLSGSRIIGIESFLFLGASGALLAVLYTIKSESQLDVGSDLGRRIAIRAVIGVGMGLIAGGLAFAVAASGLLKGRVIPNIPPEEMADIYLTIVYAFLSGLIT